MRRCTRNCGLREKETRRTFGCMWMFCPQAGSLRERVRPSSRIGNKLAPLMAFSERVAIYALLCLQTRSFFPFFFPLGVWRT